jgi:hypothetical protein
MFICKRRMRFENTVFCAKYVNQVAFIKNSQRKLVETTQVYIILQTERCPYCNAYEIKF